MMIELKPGDYVATDDIKDEVECRDILGAFKKAGADTAHWERDVGHGCGWMYMVWSGSGLIVGTDYPSDDCGRKRQLTPAQILATPQWVPEVGERCMCKYKATGFESKFECTVNACRNGKVWITDNTPRDNRDVVCSEGDLEFTPLPTEEDRAVEELFSVMRDTDVAITGKHGKTLAKALYRAGHYKGYRKQPQPAEDMSDPANWRAGDVLEFVRHAGRHRAGELCTVAGIDKDGDPVLTTDAIKGLGWPKILLRFHSRP